MASDQLYLDKWPMEHDLEILDINRDLLIVWQVIKEVQITKQHQEKDRMRRKNILEGSSNEDTLSLIGRTWWENVSSQRKERATSLVGFWENLGQKRVKGNPKVAIVPFLYLNYWVSGFVITLI